MRECVLTFLGVGLEDEGFEKKETRTIWMVLFRFLLLALGAWYLFKMVFYGLLRFGGFL